MPAHADTDGLMDACALCGGIPGILESIQDGERVVRPQCTDCHNIGAWAYSRYDAVFAWNEEQRKTKRED